MFLPQPLVIRKSRSSFTYLFNTALGLGLLGYGYALLDRWPSVASWDASRDYPLAGIVLLSGFINTVIFTVRPLFDRAPLMRIDETGISPRETGGLPVPWREITDYRFEKVQEGRSSYWYFFFTQTDAATGIAFDYKISADEFDSDNDQVIDLVNGYKAGDRKAIPVTKQRPSTITASLEGETLAAGYSREKELRSIALYWVIAIVLLAFGTYFGLAMKFGTVSIPLFLSDPLGFVLLGDPWLKYFWIGVLSLLLVATAFRVRDLLFTGVPLRADRKGIACADISPERINWSDISAIRVEPYGSLHITVTGGPALGERFVSIQRLALSQQEIFNGLAWLLAHFKIKFAQPWEVAPPPAAR